MRIRKHAARIISSLSIPTQSGAATAAGRQLEVHVCVLNQSPWDAMAFTPLGSALPLYSYQVLEQEEEVEGVNGFARGATGSGQSEEEAAAVSDVSGITATQSALRRHVKIQEVAEVGAAGDDKRLRRNVEVTKRSASCNNSKKIKRKNTSSCAIDGAEDEKVKMEVESAATTSVTTCKKSDGKGWRCKRQAQHPHSLCEYHLTQVRSYYSNEGNTNHVLQQQQQQQKQRPAILKINGGGGIDAEQNAAANNIKEDMKKKDSNSNGLNKSSISSSNYTGGRTRRKPGSTDFYYYYSGFGPWRGKRRSGGDRDGRDRGAINVNMSDSFDDVDGAHDAVPAMGVHDQRPDDLDDDDDEMDDPDYVVEYEGDDVVASKRKGRKPIKARSLKSLL